MTGALSWRWALRDGRHGRAGLQARQASRTYAPLNESTVGRLCLNRTTGATSLECHDVMEWAAGKRRQIRPDGRSKIMTSHAHASPGLPAWISAERVDFGGADWQGGGPATGLFRRRLASLLPGDAPDRGPSNRRPGWVRPERSTPGLPWTVDQMGDGRPKLDVWGIHHQPDWCQRKSWGRGALRRAHSP